MLLLRRVCPPRHPEGKVACRIPSRALWHTAEVKSWDRCHPLENVCPWDTSECLQMALSCLLERNVQTALEHRSGEVGNTSEEERACERQCRRVHSCPPCPWALRMALWRGGGDTDAAHVHLRGLGAQEAGSQGKRNRDVGCRAPHPWAPGAAGPGSPGATAEPGGSGEVGAEAGRERPARMRREAGLSPGGGWLGARRWPPLSRAVVGKSSRHSEYLDTFHLSRYPFSRCPCFIPHRLSPVHLSVCPSVTFRTL